MAHHTCSYRPMDDCDACRREEEAYEASMFDDEQHDPSDDVADEYEWRQAELARCSDPAQPPTRP